jgi:WhiB family redox-sensing transcriptional regulator
MSARVIEVMAWHPLVPGSESHVGMIPSGPPDLALINPGDWEWQDKALCQEVGTRLFFPERGETAEDAKRVCASCRVRRECLAFAVREGIPWGVWGGLDEAERAALGPQHLDFRPAHRKELAA